MSTVATLPRLAGRKRAIRIAGSALLLVAMVLVFPRHKLIQALASIPPFTLAAAVPIYVALHFLGSLKWRLMVNQTEARLTLLDSLRCYFGGLFANIFLPSVIGGDGLTLSALALSLGMQSGLIALSAWIGLGCGLNLPVCAWLFAWPPAKLSGFVPVTLAGIGSRELVLPAWLAPFGADPAAAASVGLAWDAVLIAGSLVGGAISKGASLAYPK